MSEKAEFKLSAKYDSKRSVFIETDLNFSTVGRLQHN